ncbi:MAG: hypothetical protein R3174_15195, partial [Gammaproteobacteria bacterium]|nr:hypothetical protein [Gammaproteobacteria bacterium]
MATKGPASDRELDALFDSVFVSPELYLQSFDLEAKSLSFTPMTAETYRSSSFLDQRIHKAQPVDARVDMLPFLETYERFRPEPRPVGFIFHTAFCCSTLLARCLQELRDTLVLKEPVPLRVLSRHWFDPSTEDLCRRMGDLLAVLLSRRFAGEAVVVKATSFCNNIMPELMDMHEGNRAVFIYSDLEESVASFLKSPASRREARA